MGRCCNSCTGRRRWVQRMEGVKMEVTDFHSYQAPICFFLPPPHLSSQCVTRWCSPVVSTENRWHWLDDSNQRQGYGEAVSTSPLPACVLAAAQGLPFLLPFTSSAFHTHLRFCLSASPWRTCILMYSAASHNFTYISEDPVRSRSERCLFSWPNQRLSKLL